MDLHYTQWAVILDVLAFMWIIGLCHFRGISWVPVLPIFGVVILGATVLMNSVVPPWGLLIGVVAMLYPVGWTVQLLFGLARQKWKK